MARRMVIERIDPEMAVVLRTKTPAEKLRTAFSMWRFARNTIRRNIARLHPDWTEEEVQRETARRMLRGNG